METWEQPFNGRTWKEMPGANPDDKKMNFALFRRGLYDPGEEGETNADRAKRVAAQWAGAPLVKRRALFAARMKERRKDESWTMAPKRAEVAESTETAEPPPINEPIIQEEPSMPRPPTPIGPRQKELLARFHALPPWRGINKRFHELTGMNDLSSLYEFLKEKKGLSDMRLDQIEGGLNALEKCGSKGHERHPRRMPVAHTPPAVMPVLTMVPLSPKEPITFDMIQAAMNRAQAAKDEAHELMRRYVMQNEGGQAA